jgi:hypothetical protein
MDGPERTQTDLPRLVDELQRHLEEGWLGVSEVVDRLAVRRADLGRAFRALLRERAAAPPGA